jgi:uncharacterized protein YdeI (YjbR/CyaY-like superfamily)
MLATNLRFFASASAFRKWLGGNHARAKELWIGFHRKGSGAASLTWEESVDAALCYGWIDGIRKRLDETRYVIRFTRRNSRSIWSVRNIARVRELVAMSLMEPAGLAAFRQMRSERSAVYAYEQRRAARLSLDHQRRFGRSAAAWEFFRAQAPSYQRTAAWWVVSAKQEETRLRRLERLIEVSAAGRRLDALAPSRGRA